MTLEDMKDAIIQADADNICGMDWGDQFEAVAFLIEERLKTLSESEIRAIYENIMGED